MPADLPESHAPLAEISQGPSAFEQFLDRNQKNLVILSILVALGAAGLVVYRGIEKSRQETAGADLNKAADLASLQKVISEHANTTAAQSAMVLLAEQQWAEGQQDNAIASLRKFIAENAEHPAVPSARASLGAKLMAQGKTGDATQEFEQLANDSNARFIAPYALVCLGDIAKLAGDATKAEAAYNRVKTEFPESSFAQTATQRITSLHAKAPAEIDPPPAPAPAENAQPTPGTGQASPSPSIQVMPAPNAVTPPAGDAPAPAPAPNPESAPAGDSQSAPQP